MIDVQNLSGCLLIQSSIHLEAEAVLAILARVESRSLRLIGGEVIRLEIAADRDAIRRRKTETFIDLAAVEIQLPETLGRRAEVIAGFRISPLDALHLACAEIAAEVFLTTVDRLLKRAARAGRPLKVPVKTPLTWLNESASF